MARQLNEALEIERENDRYRESFYLIKADLARIRREYLGVTRSLDEKGLDQLDEELETLSLTIENALFE